MGVEMRVGWMGRVGQTRGVGRKVRVCWVAGWRLRRAYHPVQWRN